MMDLLLILTVLFSLLTLVIIFYLIKLTNHRMAWIVISIGLLVVSFRHITWLLNIFFDIPFLVSPYFTPIVAFIMSIFLFIGLLLVVPVIKSIKGSELGYRSIFDTSGVSIWEEDLYDLYKGFEKLRKIGITDFRTYLKNHPEFVDKSIEAIRVLNVNQASLDLFKAKSKKKLLQSVGNTFTRKSRDVFIEYLISIYKGNMVFESETEYVDMEGNKLNVILKIVSPKDKDKGKHSIVSITDITARSRTEKKLLTVLGEKDTLLKELYHRTKNNMQVIIAMLNLRSYSIDSEIVYTSFNDMIGRIQSMSLVHEKLYKSENLSVIKLDEYIDELLSLLHSTEIQVNPKIKLSLSLEAVTLNIDKAIPCGLILNELVANSYKHAFKNMDNGELKISLHQQEEEVIEIIVADNGIGLPDNFNIQNCDTLGLQTVIALGEDQLQGSIDIVSHPDDSGTSCRLIFANTPGSSRV